jgi:hypothetical protein
MSGLATFFEALDPFLCGTRSVASVEAQLGRSPSGTDAMVFYRELIRRNVAKTMTDLYPSLPELTRRAGRERWPDLVSQFVSAHPPRGRHPDSMGDAFPDWLHRRRLADSARPAWLEEAADFHRCQVRAATARDRVGVPDGLDVTLFVRAYVHRAPALVADPRNADVSPGPRATFVLIYRSWRTGRVCCLRPDPIHLLALERRQSSPSRLPPARGDVSPRALDQAERWLLERGAIRPRISP